MEEDHALGRLAGTNLGIARERFGGQLLQRRECGVEILEIGDLDGAGLSDGVVRRGEDGGLVLDKEREAKLVGEPDGEDDVEVVIGVLLRADDVRGAGERFGFRVGREDLDFGDSELGRFARVEVEDRSSNHDEDTGRAKNGRERGARGDQGRVEFWHCRECTARHRMAGIRYWLTVQAQGETYLHHPKNSGRQR